ncbi:MAG: ABC transporter substrate-binding protein, partial [Chloroflexi bacterium]|nr:ABC transporter substrate-binding protein [Chloroflexota bacterium]
MTQAIRLSRRSILSLALAGASVAILAACGGQQAASSPPAASSNPAASASVAPVSTSPAASAAAPAGSSAAASAKPAGSVSAPAGASASAQPKLGGTLKVGQVGDIPNLEAQSPVGAIAATISQAYDKLAILGPQIDPEPRLAESWDIDPTFMKFKLNLRKGVQYHTGRELTSDDVKYNWQRVLGPAIKNLNSGLAAQAAWFPSVDTPDKYTVIMNADKPRPGFFDFLNGFSIVDKDTMEGPDAKTKVVGTGPFVFKEWRQAEALVMEKNKNYWMTGKPYLDGVQWVILKDAAAMSAQLEAGAVDVIYLPAITDAKRLGDSGKFNAIFNRSIGQYFYLQSNVTKPPFDQKAARQASAWALDRQRISMTVLSGLLGPPVSLPWPASSAASEPAKNNTYTFDLDKAAALFKQAGAASATFDITYSTAGYGQEYASMAQILQSDLDKIGIKTTLKPLDGPTFTAKALALDYVGLRIGANVGAASSEPSTLFQGGNALNYVNNFSGFKDPKYDQLVQAASSEPDATKRKAVYSQLNDYILDQAFCNCFSLYPSIIVTSPRVQSLDFT